MKLIGDVTFYFYNQLGLLIKCDIHQNMHIMVIWSRYSGRCSPFDKNYYFVFLFSLSLSSSYLCVIS